MPRLFIAVNVPPWPALEQVLHQLGRVEGLRPVSAEQLHLTLRFLGETAEELAAALGPALDRAVGDLDMAAVDLHLTGLGRLPKGRRPARVVYAQPDAAGAEALRALARGVDRQLAELEPGLPPRDRPFTPHLTLARVKGRHVARDELRALLQEYADHDLGRARISEVHLIESQLTPQGPIYTTRHTAKLGLG